MAARLSQATHMVGCSGLRVGLQGVDVVVVKKAHQSTSQAGVKKLGEHVQSGPANIKVVATKGGVRFVKGFDDKGEWTVDQGGGLGRTLVRPGVDKRRRQQVDEGLAFKVPEGHKPSQMSSTLVV